MKRLRKCAFAHNSFYRPVLHTCIYRCMSSTPDPASAYITEAQLEAFERRIMDAVHHRCDILASCLREDAARVKKIEITNENTLGILSDELIRVENEIEVSQLIYSLHGCDSWEDMFRDNVPELEEKCRGIQIAIDEETARQLESNSSSALPSSIRLPAVTDAVTHASILDPELCAKTAIRNDFD